MLKKLFLLCIASTMYADVPSIESLLTIDDLKYYQGNIKNLTPELLQSLQKEHLCQTDTTNKKRSSSLLFRKLAYEALHNCGHPCPELVSITNDSDKKAITVGSGVCMIQDAVSVSINFNEKTSMARSGLGVIRFIMHHEAWHIVSHHYANLIAQNEHYYHAMQEREIEADQHAVTTTSCMQCALDCVTYFLRCHAKNNPYQALKKYTQCTTRNMRSISPNRIKIAINEITTFSRARKSKHPLDLERAFRIYLDARSLGNCLCSYHQEKSTSATVAKSQATLP